MTIEEKARAYDKALKRARALYSQDAPDSLTLESMFPELKEESEDEKTRKALLNEFIHLQSKGYKFAGLEGEEIISWLEKKGEQKATDNNKPKFKVGDKVCAISNRFECTIESIDESTYYGDTTNFDIKDQDKWKLIEQKPTEQVEPKFKVGDWITNSIETVQITGYDIDYGYQVDYKGNLQHRDTNIIEKEYHLWTIQDAKDGDVLVNGDEIVIFKKNSFNEKDLSGCMFVHCSLRDKKGSWYTIGGINPSNYLPATKAQRDKLFETMKEAGYEWDAEKKELKKINSYCQEHCKGYQETGKCYADGECEAKKNAETGWSEEDKKMSRCIGNAITADDASTYLESKDIQVIDAHVWLDELKDRVQPKQDWSEDDKRVLSLLLNNYKQVVEHRSSSLTHAEVLDIYNWLKSLKDRVQPQSLTVTDEELAQAKKDAYNDALYKIEYHSGEPTFDDGWSAAIWYLKKRNALPHSQWKPSDEQMADLYTMVCECRPADKQLLQDLYYRLKTLRGE